MPPASSHTGSAEERPGGHGRLYDQADDLVGQTGNESKEKKGQLNQTLTVLSVFWIV
jgi:hypothetical protein